MSVFGDLMCNGLCEVSCDGLCDVLCADLFHVWGEVLCDVLV